MNGPGEARRLIHELLDGTIGKDDFARLQEILLREPAARKDYYALMCTDQMLVDTYEMPADLAAEARKVIELAPRRKIRFGRVFAAAAAIAILGISVTMLVRANRPRVTMTGSADSHFLIDGKTATSRLWAKGQVLEVKDGMVMAKLNEATDACIDGIATLRLTSNRGDLELRRGKAFFRVSPGAGAFEVQVAGATVRHLGTDFGILAANESSCEIHVFTGSVEIDRPGNDRMILAAGEAAFWQDGGATRHTPLESGAFRQSLPDQQVVFDDDFSDPKGTLLNGKKPDVGQPWKVAGERLPTVAGAGRLDTSGGFRHLKAPFLPIPEAGSRPVILVTFTTTVPLWNTDKKTRMSGIERITLLDAGGKAIGSLIALARDDHRWKLRDEGTKQESEPTALSAIEPNDLTLRFDPGRGKISLHAGPTAQGALLAELPVDSSALPASLELMNDYGGDLALRQITARLVTSHAAPPP